VRKGPQPPAVAVFADAIIFRLVKRIIGKLPVSLPIIREDQAKRKAPPSPAGPFFFTGAPRSPQNRHPAPRIRYSARGVPNR
jgi:hypothetical protein